MGHFIEILKIVIISMIQGITEWLPVSSTGHMILADEFIRLSFTPEFISMFLVVVQFGSILAVVTLYFNKLNPFSFGKSPQEKADTFSLWFKVLVAIIPAGIIGVLFEDAIDALFYNASTVAVTLILYGIFFIIIENRKKRTAINHLDSLNYKTAFLIGVFQVLALIPGTSRSGTTILGAVLLGCSRYVAAEFSFFLAVPIMLGASGLKLLKFGFSYEPIELVALITGLVVAYAVSILAIKFLMEYIKKHDFKLFGYYRIVLGLVILLYFMINR